MNDIRTYLNSFNDAFTRLSFAREQVLGLNDDDNPNVRKLPTLYYYAKCRRFLQDDTDDDWDQSIIVSFVTFIDSPNLILYYTEAWKRLILDQFDRDFIPHMGLFYIQYMIFVDLYSDILASDNKFTSDAFPTYRTFHQSVTTYVDGLNANIDHDELDIQGSDHHVNFLEIKNKFDIGNLERFEIRLKFYPQMVRRNRYIPNVIFRRTFENLQSASTWNGEEFDQNLRHQPEIREIRFNRNHRRQRRRGRNRR